MNTAILVSSFKYLCKFETVVSLSSWVYTELANARYTNYKLIYSFHNNMLQVTESILRSVSYIDRSILDKLLFETSQCMCDLEDDETYVRMKLLLEYGACPNETMLEDACFLYCVKTVELLLRYNVKLTDQALVHACCPRSTDIIKMFLKRDVTITYDIFEEVCCDTEWYSNIEAIKVLLDAGSDVYIDKVLTKARRSLSQDVINLLERYKAAMTHN